MTPAGSPPAASAAGTPRWRPASAPPTVVRDGDGAAERPLRECRRGRRRRPGRRGADAAARSSRRARRPRAARAGRGPAPRDPSTSSDHGGADRWPRAVTSASVVCVHDGAVDTDTGGRGGLHASCCSTGCASARPSGAARPAPARVDTDRAAPPSPREPDPERPRARRSPRNRHASPRPTCRAAGGPAARSGPTSSPAAAELLGLRRPAAHGHADRAPRRRGRAGDGVPDAVPRAVPDPPAAARRRRTTAATTPRWPPTTPRRSTAARRWRPGTPSWSEHAYGRAIDVNPVENPYLFDGRVLPPRGAAYLDRATSGPAWPFAAGCWSRRSPRSAGRGAGPGVRPRLPALQQQRRLTVSRCPPAQFAPGQRAAVHLVRAVGQAQRAGRAPTARPAGCPG